MLKKIIIVGLLSLSFYAKAQDSKYIIDSLKKCINVGTQRQQFKTFIQLSDEYSNSNLVLSKYYSFKAYKLANDLKNNTFIALSYNNIGNIHQYCSELDSALIYHKKALKIRQTNRDSLGIAESYNNLGIVFDAKGQFNESLKYYFKALYYFEKKNSIANQAMVNANIGIVYKAQKEYGKAFGYYEKAYKLYSKTNDKFGQTSAECNLGSVLINLKRYSQSIKFSLLAKQGYQNLGNQRFLAYPISNIACAYDSLHHYELAERNYFISIKLFEKFNNYYQVSEASNLYSNCLNNQKKYAEGIVAANKALEFAKKSKAYLLEIQSYKNLYNATSKNGDFEKAIGFINKYNIGRDSLFENEKTKTVFELETKYQTVKKERLIIEQQADAKQKNILLIGISSLSFLIIIIAFLIYRQQKLKNAQQIQEFELKTAIAQIEKQNELQEQRLNISRDLHDNIGAQLTFIISSVDTIKYAFDVTNTKLDGKLQSISSFAKSTIVELRDTIWAMNNAEIHFEDLRARILNYIEKAKTAKENIEFKFTIDSSLNQEKLTSISGMNIYRTIQEAVNNAIKYAGASQISVAVNALAEKITIQIHDNGIGFDQETTEKGNGLLNMEKRIEEIGGIFNLNSKIGIGTTVSILLNKQKE